MHIPAIDTTLSLEQHGPANAPPPFQAGEFQETILELLGENPARTISEEELFSAVVAER